MSAVHFYVRECRESDAHSIMSHLESKFFVHLDDSVPSACLVSILVPRHGRKRFLLRNRTNLEDLGFTLRSGTEQEYATLLAAHAAMRPAGNRVPVPKAGKVLVTAGHRRKRA